MKATHKPNEKKLVAIITEYGDVVMAATPEIVTSEIMASGYPAYPAHVITDTVSPTSGDLLYWSKLKGSVLVYEGDEITIKF
jgi:hypothetical protein